VSVIRHSTLDDERGIGWHLKGGTNPEGLAIDHMLALGADREAAHAS
jgi:hypothetical protein